MVKADSMSDDKLIERSRDGDGRAFRLLVERYEGMVAATVIGMLGRGPEAEDVGQETFIRFYRALDRFRGDSSVGTYVTRIAINQSLKVIRKRKGILGRFASMEPEDLEITDESQNPVHTYDDDERRRLVHEAIQTLSPEHRAVVVLRMLREYSTTETAGMLGIPPGTVMSRLSRALDKLGKVLSPLLQESADVRDDT